MKTEVRIDKWLWAMRVFKTRTVATDSCKKGRVSLKISGKDPEVTAKPSRMIKIGDVVMVRKPPITYSFEVKALTENRLGAKLGRPTKREGRELASFTDQIYSDDSDFGFDFDEDDFDE